MNILAHIHFRDPLHYKEIGPPTVIKIKNFEPLQLAKKKHYFQAPSIEEFKVNKPSSKKTRSSSRELVQLPQSKQQGRPFNESLNARFLYFDTIDSMISEMLNSKVDKLTLITDFGSFKKDGFMMSNSMQLQVRIPEEPEYHLQQIEFGHEDLDEEDGLPDIIPTLCSTFDTDQVSFVKIIRNNKGQLVKFEVLSDLKDEELSVNYIKKFITYPRYKSKMKIYLIRGKFDKNVWFYNDLRMLIWDLENVYLGDKKILINNHILSE